MPKHAVTRSGCRAAPELLHSPSRTTLDSVMDDNRLPLHCRSLPAIDWRLSARRIHLDPAADELARYQLYRYCSLPEALQLLGRGQWSFAHPTTWPDKYEHHLSRELFGAQSVSAQVVMTAKLHLTH